MAVFIDLLDETIVHILALLDARDIAQCQQVCRKLNSLVTSSACLVYILTLDSLSYNLPSTPRSDITLVDKIELLRQHRLHWARPDTLQAARYNLSFRSSPMDVYIGGVLVQAYPGTPASYFHTLHFYQLQSKNLGVQFQEWNLDNLGPNLCKFTVDPDQNLLVLFETSDLNNSESLPENQFRVHLRTMSDNQPHPSALTSAMIVSFGEEPKEDSETPFYMYSLTVSGALLTITLESVSHKFSSWIIICDWHRGVEVTRAPFAQFLGPSFALLSPSMILLPHYFDATEESPQKPNHTTNATYGSLDLYTFDPHCDSSTPLHLISSFALPPLDKGHSGSVIVIHCAPSIWPCGRTREKVYEPSREHAIYVTVYGTSGAPRNMLISTLGVLYIPANVLLDTVYHGRTRDTCGYAPGGCPEPAVAPWNTWAHRTTWVDTGVFVDPGGIDEQRFCFEHRMAGPWAETLDDDRLCDVLLIDFSQKRSWWRELHMPNTESESGKGYIPRTSRSSRGRDIFCRENASARTNFAGILLELEQDPNISGSFGQVIIDDEHLIVVQTTISDGSTFQFKESSSLLVYTF